MRMGTWGGSTKPRPIADRTWRVIMLVGERMRASTSVDDVNTEEEAIDKAKEHLGWRVEGSWYMARECCPDCYWPLEFHDETCSRDPYMGWI